VTKGTITEAECAARWNTECPPDPFIVQTMTLAVDTVKINSTLGREDFDVPVPAGSFVVDAQTNKSWVLRPWQERYRVAIFVGLGALLAVGTAGGGYWFYRRRS